MAALAPGGAAALDDSGSVFSEIKALRLQVQDVASLLRELRAEVGERSGAMERQVCDIQAEVSANTAALRSLLPGAPVAVETSPTKALACNRSGDGAEGGDCVIQASPRCHEPDAEACVGEAPAGPAGDVHKPSAGVGQRLDGTALPPGQAPPAAAAAAADTREEQKLAAQTPGPKPELAESAKSEGDPELEGTHVAGGQAMADGPVDVTLWRPQIHLRSTEGRPELTTAAVAIESADAGRQQWNVVPQGQTQTIAARPDRLELHERPWPQEEVVIQQLRSRPELNGQRGRLGPFQASRGRWAVQIPGETSPLLLLSSALTRACDGCALSDPIEARVALFGAAEQQGLFAKADFAPGALLFEEEPLLAVDQGSLPVGAVSKFLELPGELRQKVLSLCAREEISFASSRKDAPKLDTEAGMMAFLASRGTKVSPEESGAVWLFLRVLAANAFNTGDLAILYLTLCRANHSCEPNAARFVVAGKSMAVVALRPIRIGEEICISYVQEQSLFSCARDRQQKIQTAFDFECRCTRCRSPEDLMRSFLCQRSGCAGRLHADADGCSQCSACGSRCGAADWKALLQREAVIVGLFQDLDQKARAGMVRGPQDVERVLDHAAKTLSECHWAVERLHNMAYELHTFAEDHAEAYLHQASRLRFMDAHLRGLSLRRGIERVKLADTLSRLGRLGEAVELGSLGLSELRMVVTSDREGCRAAAEGSPKHCAVARERLRGYLDAVGQKARRGPRG